MKILDVFNSFRNGNLFPHSNRPYIIAEAGVNHEGDIEIAKRLIDEAKEGGADCIKFQTYKANLIASKNSPAYWDIEKEPTKNQFQLFQKYDLFWKKEFEILSGYCERADIEFMSTPFDLESAKFLNDLMSVFKISSSDITNKPFIEYICGFKKPIILSTGASQICEIQEAVDWVDSKSVEVALLHCILNYPTVDHNSNLGMISDLKSKFPEKIVGYSDHTLPKDMKILEVATLLGASILEKHFTYDKTLRGNDHYHAMDRDDLKIFRQNLKKLYSIIGLMKKSSIESEKLARENARRSLVAKCEISKGAKISDKHLTWKRPASGISPKEIEKVIGKTAVRNIFEDEIITWDLLV